MTHLSVVDGPILLLPIAPLEQYRHTTSSSSYFLEKQLGYRNIFAHSPSSTQSIVPPPSPPPLFRKLILRFEFFSNRDLCYFFYDY